MRKLFLLLLLCAGLLGAQTVVSTSLVPLPNVTLSFTGGWTATSDPTGSFALSLPSDWTGYITPSAPGFTFSPSTAFAATSSTVVFTAADTQAPTIGIQFPAGQTLTSGNYTFACWAADNWGVQMVIWQIDGVTIGTATAPPWSIQYHVTHMKGTHNVIAFVYDLAGNSNSASSYVTFK